MFEWFLLAFGKPKEQARLFMVLISTLLAITILLLNQWFINRWAKKERMIMKLEELTTAVHGLSSSTLAAGSSLLIDRNMDDDNIAKFEASYAEIEKLCALYFRGNPISTSGLPEIKGLLSYSKKSCNSELETDDQQQLGETFIQLAKDISRWSVDANAVLNVLTKNHIK